MQENNLITMIQLRETNLHVGSYIIPLYGRKKMMQLIQAMIEGDRGLSRPALRMAIYKNNPDEKLSVRLQESQDCSLSKLISRSRRHLKVALGGTNWGRAIDWFVYDEQGKYWQFHKLKASAVAQLMIPPPSFDSPFIPEKSSEEVRGKLPPPNVQA